MSEEIRPAGRPLSGAEADALTAAILARTSGAVCPSIEERLLARADGLLGPIDRELVEEHLARCASCAAIAGALDLLREELPAMLEVDPGPWFTEQVLRRTSRAPQPSRPAWIVQLLDHVHTILRRPRIALEAAYIAALVLFLLTGFPSSFVQSIPALTAGFGRDASSIAILENGTIAPRLEGIERDWRDRLRGSPAGIAVGSVERIAAVVAREGGRIAGSVEVAARETSDGAGALLRGDPEGMGRAWEDLRNGMRRLWSDPEDPNSKKGSEPGETGVRPERETGQVSP